ncbi:MAG TPA: DUF3108 domain-containing protein [Vicinamibacterales bacterium]|nr:DUF3108 domain-containing protein [Vicinamibacterales bacterium]
MQKSHLRLICRPAAVLTALVVAALMADSALPSAQAERPVPFKVGETLTFDVSWTTFMSAGTATMSVLERRPGSAGRNAYYLVAEGKPSPMLGKLYSVYYKAESMLDTRTLLPSLATVYSDEAGRKRYKTTTFKGNGSVVYEIKTSTTATSTIKAPATAQDPLGAIYILRALPLKAGMTASIPIPIIDSGKAYTMRVKVGGLESVKSGLGTLQALKLSATIVDAAGKPEGTGFSLWLSDDARKLPLKISAGLAVGSVYLTLARVGG